MLFRCLSVLVGLALWAAPAMAADAFSWREDFESLPLGEAPAGWTPFHEGAKPSAAIAEPEGTGKGRCLKVLSTSQGGFVALSKALDPAQKRLWVEFSFAFSPGRGRTFNVWSHEPGGADASQINLCIERGRLKQYDGLTKQWTLITPELEPTRDPQKPKWHRMRIVAGHKSEAIDYYVSKPGSLDLPAKPTATKRAYRNGLLFGALDFVSGARLAKNAFYFIDDLTVRGGEDLAGPQGTLRPPKQFEFWDASVPVPSAAEAPLLKDVAFHVIKKREPDVDGYNWLHGLAICWHEGTLFSTWGHNKGDENTPTEQTRGSHSRDGGKTWSPVWTVASHTETEARSHGVLLSHKGQLWSFAGRFGEHFTNLRAEAYVLKQGTPKGSGPAVWEPKGVVAETFWPCDEPVRMSDGNWIMAGMDIPDGPSWAHPGVAISHGDDFTRWDTVLVDVPAEFRAIWGESTVIVDEQEVILFIRPAWGDHYSLACSSKDCGRTWSELQWTNLPMPSTKAYAGMLSTGQRYVVGTLVTDHKGKRFPVTIAVSDPGGKKLCRMYRIRDDVFPEGPGESIKGAALSYPYAQEHDGKLYVVYSNDGGRGRNLNSAEMAVIPIAALAGSEGGR